MQKSQNGESDGQKNEENTTRSKERRESFLKSAKSLGIVNQHRVAAYDSKQVAALIDSKQVIFHPQIKVYAGDGQRSYLKHHDNIYVFNEPHVFCLIFRQLNKPTTAVTSLLS